ncbi:MAG TPA: DciA family protein [bacterium]|nr:DciA family protein [bacterium]
MPAITKIISDIPADRELLTAVLFQWTAIVGKKSRNMLFPYEFDRRKRVLKVAVPNSMVRAQYEPLLPLIVEKMARILPEARVAGIALSVEPRHFEKKKRRPPARPPRPAPDPATVAEAERRLIAGGVSPEKARVLAEIAVLIDEKRRADH